MITFLPFSKVLKKEGSTSVKSMETNEERNPAGCLAPSEQNTSLNFPQANYVPWFA
jgi:hypothetical protein